MYHNGGYLEYASQFEGFNQIGNLPDFFILQENSMTPNVHYVYIQARSNMDWGQWAKVRYVLNDELYSVLLQKLGEGDKEQDIIQLIKKGAE